MIVGIGFDITDIDRIRRVLAEKRERFLKKIYTEKETAYCLRRKDPAPCLAARFAAKEAFSKCLGLGWEGNISWLDVSVVNDSRGKPELLLKNNALSATLGKKVWVTLTHTDTVAAATVIIEED
jgi:holo-[acyl-carrier protein] synthase